MKKKALSILVVVALMANMMSAFAVTASAAGYKDVALSLDYDELTTFSDTLPAYTCADVSEELKSVLKVDTQSLHGIYSASMVYYPDSFGGMTKPTKEIDRKTTYYIGLTLYFKTANEPVYNLDSLKFNGRTLEAAKSGEKPIAGQYYKGQNSAATVDGVKKYTLSLIIPVEVLPKYEATKPILENTTFEYTGSPIKPVIQKMNEDIMTVDAASDVQATNVGTYKIVVKLNDKSNYRFVKSNSDDLVLEWKIVPASYITKLVLGEENYYNGAKVVPSVQVFAGDKDVTSQTSTYEVKAGENILPGTYTLEVVCKGNYTGSISGEYTIKVKPTEVVSLKKASKSFKITLAEQPAENVTGYQLRYSLKSNMSKAKTVTIGTKSTAVSKTVKKLKAKKKYYVQARSYVTVDGTKYYSDWSATKSVKTK